MWTDHFSKIHPVSIWSISDSSPTPVAYLHMYGAFVVIFVLIFSNDSISEFKFLDLQNIKASNHDVVSAEIFIVHDGQPIFLNPEKRKYFARGQITSETAIHASILKDTYLTIGDQLDDGSWTFSLQINYFIKWIWLSSALMVIGILMTIMLL